MNAEVIIVGGGIIGCAAAYNLAKNGVSVLLLEGSKNIGNGGSTRNGGGVRQSGRDPRELPLVMYSIEHIWPQLSDMLDTNVEYYQEGNLRPRYEANLRAKGPELKIGNDYELADYLIAKIRDAYFEMWQ